MKRTMNLFEVLSPLNKRIRLTKTQWDQITLKHREMKNQESRLRQTLIDPDFVLYSQSDENYQYHRFFTEPLASEKHLLVVVKHLNGDGFVITAFFLSKVREKGKVKIYER